MHAHTSPLPPLRAGSVLSPTAAFALVALLLAVPILLFWPTAVAMSSVWSRSETFTHGWLVLPASLWFVWQRRAELAATPLAPCFPALLVVTGAGMLWLVAELSGSNAPAHFALVTLAVGTVIAATGMAWARVLAFPLLFLFFAVPFGEALVPVLIDWTADFTVAALRLVGVPVFREGNDFTVPSGRWSVVEACSGVRYLLASLMIGTLYAWVMYRSPRRRALFMLAALLVPVVANWLRAFLIVLLGHLSDNRIAAGVDHLIYGWVFFGIVIFALFALGARWREDEPQAPAAALAPAALPLGALGAGMLAAFAALALWPVAALALMAPVDVRAIAPVAPVDAGGWRGGDAQASWRPQWQAPRATLLRTYVRDGAAVSVHLAFFRAQSQGAELVSSAHTIAAEKSGWRALARGAAQAQVAGVPVDWRSVVLRGDDGRYVRVWIAYWLGGAWTASDSRAKLDLAADRLLRRPDTSAWVALSVPHDVERPQQSEAALREFVDSMGAPLSQALAQSAR
ncbi:MAG: exosortase A [Burkholderiaceae bacterium]|jgi:exosortase A|nr:exosortase A [Burkholderiaceae bacterium]